MAGQLLTLRNGIATGLEAIREASGFEYNGFSTSQTWIPLSLLTDASTKAGRLWIIGSSLGDEERASRAGQPFVSRDLICQVSYQQSDISDNPAGNRDSTLDTLVDLQEQLRSAVKNLSIPGLTWIRNVGMKDEDGIPFSYFAIREANLFEAYFAAYFQVLYT
jgi:hypothetical protein